MSKTEIHPRKILLLDLDCVTIVGHHNTTSQSEEIRLLHPELAELIKAQKIDIVLFTHRAFADADQISKALSKFGIPVLHCISAREMLMSAIRQFRFVELLSGGLSKKFGVASAVKKTGVLPSQLTLIDDRPEILNEVLAEGIGLAIQAPFTNDDNQRFVSFDFSEAFDVINSCPHNTPVSTVLQAVTKPIVDLPLLLSIPINRATYISLLVRKTFRNTRRLMRKMRG